MKFIERHKAGTSDTELVSICLVCYNQEKYILEALEGVISQNYKNLEIIISDDNSTDRTFEIIKSFVAEHNHSFKFILNKNNKNLGIAGNVNKAIELCSGKYILLAAGDDISLPERVSFSINTMKETNVLSSTFNALVVDSNSNVTGKLFASSIPSYTYKIKDYLNYNIISSGPTRVIDREIMEIFGPINSDCPTEDSVFNFRAILAGGLNFSNKVVASYRIHDNNISGNKNMMTKINPVSIHKQYRRDLETAHNKNLINESDYTSIRDHIDHYKKREVANREIYNATSLIDKGFLFLRLLFSLEFSLNEKRKFYRIFKSSIYETK